MDISVKIGKRTVQRGPRSSVGVKKFLLGLNRDLDAIKRSVLFNSNYYFISQASLPPQEGNFLPIEISVLYLEDRRFFLHRGAEFRSIARGVKRYVKGNGFGGISTIDQQVVRISVARYERTVSRKAREILLAIFLNFHLTKRDIFSYYLNNAYLGHRMSGCEEAANLIFNMRADKLDQDQAAFIASLFPLPFPRSVWETYSKMGFYPLSDPYEIISFAEAIAPRWAKRVRNRMNLAMSAYDFSPKSL
ncbi:hypothetical protein DDE20_11990 [Pararhodobacter oceanensis]|uniref:Glycosyl transferase family 51 domain-containing protein n=2 Tax=Pararhodobacter oceanensis TaxID=2172121 RepID=A0A2T8HSE7_9RHOB|nr:hypothetical protein DDE20_11990 [Pararhodobacter oceanensis]